MLSNIHSLQQCSRRAARYFTKEPEVADGRPAEAAAFGCWPLQNKAASNQTFLPLACLTTTGTPTIEVSKSRMAATTIHTPYNYSHGHNSIYNGFSFENQQSSIYVSSKLALSKTY